jgi:integrase
LNLNDKLQLTALNTQVEKYIHSALSTNTRIAYKNDLAHFISWGGTIPSTPKIISHYLAFYADSNAPATLNRRIVSINRAHTSQNLPSPTNTDLVKATLRGIRRTLGTKQRQVEPILKDDLIKMVSSLAGIRGCRDRALLMIGFAGALRRSELVGLQFNDIEFVEQGLIIYLRHSKTDQEGEGRKIAVPYARGVVCPVLALKEWLEISNFCHGPLFRRIIGSSKVCDSTLSTHAVAIIVKKYAALLNLDASKFSGHSLRAGLVTSAAQAGVSAWKIKQQTGHKSDAMLNRYIRDARLFNDNAAGLIF